MSALRARDWREDDGPASAGWLDQTGQPVPSQAGADAQQLVLADAADRPIARLSLRPRLGLDLPRYSYHLGRVVHAAAELGLFRAQQTLLLGNDHTGESELAGLACAPRLSFEEQVVALRLLVRAALECVSATRADFGERLIVELAGARDDQGLSPFWQGLGRCFYAGDPVAAQARFGDAWRSHLAALLPRQTLYLSFLDEAAQAAVGQVGTPARAAEQALKACGFVFAQHVRIDDGGALLELTLPA